MATERRKNRNKKVKRTSVGKKACASKKPTGKKKIGFASSSKKRTVVKMVYRREIKDREEFNKIIQSNNRLEVELSDSIPLSALSEIIFAFNHLHEFITGKKLPDPILRVGSESSMLSSPVQK